MAKLTPFESSRLVALEVIEEDIDEAIVRILLRKYGNILNVQFWTSQSGKKHGFVTFEDPEAAARCLEYAIDEAPTLPIKPVNPTTINRYKLPEPSSWVTFNNPEQTSNPFLLTRMALPTNYHAATSQPGQQKTQNGIPDFPAWRPLAHPPPSTSPLRVDTGSSSGVQAPAQPGNSQIPHLATLARDAFISRPSMFESARTTRSAIPSAPLQGVQPAPTSQATLTDPLQDHGQSQSNKTEVPRNGQAASSQPDRPAPAGNPELLKAAIKSLRDKLKSAIDARTTADNALSQDALRHEKEKAQLLQDIEEKDEEMQRYKEEREFRSKDIEARIQEVKSYKAERERLLAEVADMKEKVGFYKADSEKILADLKREADINLEREAALRKDLAAELRRETEQHRKQEADLQNHLRRASNELSRLKKELANQAQLLAQRTLELEKSQQKVVLQALASPSPQSRFLKEKCTRMDVDHVGNLSEPEEGQLPSDQQSTGAISTTLPKPLTPSPSHRNAVIPILEQAYIYLDEITSAALINENREQGGPNKRQKRDEDA